MTRSRKITLTLLVALIGGAAFRLSFDAQVTLAIASGIDPGLGWLYPGVVDAAILTGMLLRIWFPDAGAGLIRYLWAAIAFWTFTSIAGNAIHIIALPDGRITVPLELAIAVNTVPALTLFLIIHIVTSIAAAPPKAVGRKRTAPLDAAVRAGAMSVNEARAANGIPRPPKRVRTDIPPVSDEQLLELARTMTVREIAAETGRGKTWVSERLREIRDREQPETEPQEA